MIKIEYLADHLELIPILAQYNYDEWSCDWKNLNETVSAYTKAVHKDQIPLTLVALDDENNLLGFVSLVDREVNSCENLSPWLAGLYVLPEYRGKGVGRELVKRIMREAEHLEIKRFYLETGNDSRVDFYAAFGWKKLKHKGINDVVMEYVFDIEK